MTNRAYGELNAAYALSVVLNDISYVKVWEIIRKDHDRIAGWHFHG